MLQKIVSYHDEDGELINIEDEKIYWDTNKNQFRHKFNCCDCGKPLDCMCYDSLSSAKSGVDDGLICEDCGIKYTLDGTSIDDLLWDLDEERMAKVNTFLDTLVTEKEIEEFQEETGCKTLSRSDKMDIIEGNDKEDTLHDYIVGLLTKDEKIDMWFESCDGFPEGEACNI